MYLWYMYMYNTCKATLHKKLGHVHAHTHTHTHNLSSNNVLCYITHLNHVQCHAILKTVCDLHYIIIQHSR